MCTKFNLIVAGSVIIIGLFVMMSLLHPPPRQGKCRNSTSCVVGLRHRTYHILSGSVLGVWTHIEGVFARHSTHNPRMQIIRVRTPGSLPLPSSPPPLVWRASPSSFSHARREEGLACQTIPPYALSLYLFWLVNSAIVI